MSPAIRLILIITLSVAGSATFAAEQISPYQQAIIEILDTFRQQYNSGNAVKQTKAIRSRTQALEQLSPKPKNHYIAFDDFIATVFQVEVDAFDNATLMVRLVDQEGSGRRSVTLMSVPPAIEPLFSTTSGADYRAPTATPPNAPLWDVIAELSKGQKIKISGGIAWDPTWFFRPAQIEDLEDNMDSTIFIARFTKIEPL